MSGFRAQYLHILAYLGAPFTIQVKPVKTQAAAQLMHFLHLRKPLAFFDLETTGTNTATDRIVEIGIVIARPDGTLDKKQRYVNPTIPIPAEATAVHGISDEMVADMPTFRQIARSLEQLLQGCDLAGFNVLKFDVPMLVEEFLRADIDFDLEGRSILDAQRIFHLMEPRTLSAAYKFYCGGEIGELGERGAHAADVDALASYHVLMKQVERYAGVKLEDKTKGEYEPIKNDVKALHDLTFSKIVDLAGRMAYNAKGEVVFTFGKHKDKSVEEVLRKEPSYYQWMMDGDFPRDTKRHLTRIKLSLKN